MHHTNHTSRSNHTSPRLSHLVVACLVTVAALTAWIAPAHGVYLDTGSFSGPGTGDGELSFPGRAAVEHSTGNLFVADTNNDRVQVFAPDGGSMSYLTQFGGGVLDGPYGIAVDQDSGDVYVSDTASARVVKFESDGAATPSFSVDAAFASPAAAGALAFDQQAGELVVANPADDTIGRYTTAGVLVGSPFDGSTSPGGAFTDPTDVAVDSTGDILVVDATGDIVSDTSGTSSRVERFTSTGAHQATIGPVDGPATVAVDPDGDRVIVGGRAHSYNSSVPPRLYVFDADGTPAGGADVNAMWSIVRGLAVVGDGSNRLYAITADPFDGPWGPTGGYVFEDIPAAAPELTLDPATGIDADSATIAGTVDPNLRTTTYELQYRGGPVADWTAIPGSAGETGTGTDPIPVQATLAGLDPNTEYEVRLIASNDQGSTESPVSSFTTDAVELVLETLTTLERTTTTAHLTGRVNPRGLQTTYRFEYGTTTAYGQQTPATDAGAGQALVPVAADITGLQPNTTYHYRLVATSAEGTVEGENRTVTTHATDTEPGCPNADIRHQQRAEHVGSCRAFELLNPPDTNQNRAGGGVLREDGDRAIWRGSGGMLDSPSGGLAHLFVARRMAHGWESSSVMPDRADMYDISYSVQAATPDFSRMVATASRFGLTPANEPAAVRLDGAGGQELLQLFPGTHPPSALIASRDLEHVYYLWDGAAMVAEHPPFTGQLYDSGSGQPELVGRLPDGSVPMCGIDQFEFPYAGTNPVTASQNWTSSDGSRVVFRTRGNDCSGPQQLYMREGGSAGSTAWVSEPPPGEPAGSAWFVQATSDLSEIFFVSDARLVVDGPRADLNGFPDVYHYAVGGEVECVTCLVPAADVAFSSEQGGVAVSADGSRVYFNSTRELVPGMRGGSGENLYVIEDGALRFVAPMELGSGFAHDPSGQMAAANAALNDDGSVVVFETEAQVTDYDNGGRSQLYRYSDIDRSLTCVSCPRGRVPQSDTLLATAGGIGDVGTGSPMSSDGSRVAFGTRESLVARDTNGSQDIYEWVDGKVRLVTDGRIVDRGQQTVQLLQVTGDGRSILFWSDRALVPELRDERPAFQLYVARIDGGFLQPDPVGEACSGDGCQGAAGVSRGASGPATAGLRGPGDARLTRGSFSVASLSAVQLRRLGRGGRAVLAVRVDRPGRVQATLRAGGGVVGSASRVARREGTVRLGLRLSRPARRRLAREGRLAVRLAVRFEGSRVSRGSRLVLRVGRGDR